MRFSISETILMLSGRDITGFHSGADSFTVERIANTGNLTIGANGDGVFVATNNKSIRLTLNLLQNHDDNKFMSDMLAMQENNFKDFAPMALYIKDLINGDVYDGEDGWFEVVPPYARGNEYNSQQWQIVFTKGSPNLK